MAQEPFNLLARYRLLEEALQNPRLSKGDCAVLSVILSHVDEDGEAWPGMTRICERARIDRRSAIRSVQRLEDACFLSVSRMRGRSNTYLIVERPRRTSDADVTCPSGEPGIDW